MSESIANLSATDDATYGHGQSPTPQPEIVQSAPADPEAAEFDELADMRLIIEGGPDAAAPLHYKTIDGRTGAVVHDWLDDQVLRMREAKTYAAGQLIKTSA